MAGRPSDYTPELIAKAVKYVDTEGTVSDDVLPTIAGLAVYLGISRETIRLWAADKNKPEFFGIVEQLMAKQEKKLINGSIMNDYNATISKLLLSKHGYSDKQETTLQGPEGGPIAVAWEVQPVASGQAKDSDS